MGSASREALAHARTALRPTIGASAGAELLRAAGRIADNHGLAAALADASAPATSKAQLAERLFGDLSADARGVLVAAVSERWSNADDCVTGIEELGIRAEAITNPSLADELLAIADVIDRDHELELTLGNRLGSVDGKVALLRGLLAGKTSASAVAVASHHVASPRGRRLGATLRLAARTAADQLGSELATVTVAAPLSAHQQTRLAKLLERTAGRPVRITTIVAPELIGGIRVQLADDVIDGSVRARLDDLRQQLAA